MEVNGIWSERFKLKAFMVDQQRKLTLPMLSNLLQEVAGNHANFRKLGFFDMQENHRLWVLNRMLLEVTAFPLWLDEVEVQTWVSMMRGPFSNRHFAVFKNGEQIASSFTFWVAIDSRTHKPVRINSDGVVVLENKIADCGPAEKIASPKPGAPIARYTVRKSDIDMLGHVNNVKYIEWIFDHVPISEPIRKIAINYLKETHLGDTVSLDRTEDTICIRNEHTGEVLCVVQLNP